MRRLLRGALSDASYRVLRLTNGRPHGLRILTYHRVTDAHPGDRLCVPVRRFEEQMRRLRDWGYRTISVADAVRWISSPAGNGHADMDRAVVLTFDDGYEDNYAHAYPAMAHHGFSAAFFVPSAFIAGGPHQFHAADRPMSWKQLQELLRQGHEIGAHSVTHRRLAHISPADVPAEVEDCKRSLEQGLQQPVDYFCYPAGDYNAQVRAAVAAAGYRGACTVEPGANHPGADPFTLKRTEISACDSLWDVEKKLAGAYDWLHRIWQTSWRT